MKCKLKPYMYVDCVYGSGKKYWTYSQMPLMITTSHIVCCMHQENLR